MSSSRPRAFWVARYEMMKDEAGRETPVVVTIPRKAFAVGANDNCYGENGVWRDSSTKRGLWPTHEIRTRNVEHKSFAAAKNDSETRRVDMGVLRDRKQAGSGLSLYVCGASIPANLYNINHPARAF